MDITSGKFVFSASEAYRIEDGKIGAPVKGATLIGNGPDVLGRVSRIRITSYNVCYTKLLRLPWCRPPVRTAAHLLRRIVSLQRRPCDGRHDPGPEAKESRNNFV